MINKSSVVSVLALFSSLSYAQEGAQIKVGAFDVVPTVGLTEAYKDNVFKQEDGEELSSWITTISPAVQAVADNGQSRYQLAYKNETGLYHSSHKDDYVDHTFEAAADWELSSRHRLGVSASYYDGHDERGTVFTSGRANSIDSPDELVDEEVGVKYTYGAEGSVGQVVVSYDRLDKEYTNHRDATRVRDRVTDTFETAFNWKAFSNTTLSLELAYEDTEYEFTENDGVLLDNDEKRALLGVTWAPGGPISGFIKAGQEKKEFEADIRDDDTVFIWDVSVKWSPIDRTVLALDSSRSAEESTSDSSLYTDTKNYKLTWTHGWSDRLSSKLYYSYADEDYVEDAEDKHNKTSEYGLGLDFALRDWLDTGVHYYYADRDSNVAVDEYTGNVFELNLNLKMQ